MYLHNKYTTYYYNIINIAKARNTLRRTKGTERHHIIPICLNGDNSIDNLVVLTTREHFVCHWLLTKMVSKQNDKWLIWNAFNLMLHIENKHQERYKVNSRLFSKLKAKYTAIKSIRMKENNPMHRPEVRAKHALAIKKRGPTRGTTGMKFSDETRAKQSASSKGQIVTTTTRKKLSNKMKQIAADPNYINPMHRPGVKERHAEGMRRRSDNHRRKKQEQLNT